MGKTEELLQKIVALLEEPDKACLRSVLADTIREALESELEQAKQGKNFHKRLNEDMLNGLHNIYKEITQVTLDPAKQGAEVPKSAAEATAIFHEASRHLEEIMQTTLEATENIMHNVETIQENQSSIAAAVDAILIGELDTVAIQQFVALIKDDIEAVNSIVEALSFQDLTGQRIKKVVTALGSIHQIVVETYVSAGLMLKKSEEEPKKDFEAIAEESKQQAAAATVAGSELKGPTLDTSQQDVDALLAKLGF